MATLGKSPGPASTATLSSVKYDLVICWVFRDLSSQGSSFANQQLTTSYRFAYWWNVDMIFSKTYLQLMLTLRRCLIQCIARHFGNSCYSIEFLRGLLIWCMTFILGLRVLCGRGVSSFSSVNTALSQGCVLASWLLNTWMNCRDFIHEVFWRTGLAYAIINSLDKGYNLIDDCVGWRSWSLSRLCSLAVRHGHYQRTWKGESKPLAVNASTEP